jgi:hypothetical protein
MRTTILAAIMLALPGAAAEQQQFDLICQGGGVTVRYRVDLARNEACSDTCDRVWKMGVPTSGELKLIDRAPAYRGDLEERSTVSRSTGEWQYRLMFHGPVTRSGVCAPASFSGFPAKKF